MTTKDEISRWFAQGVSNGYKYMLVLSDRFEHEEYPVYVGTSTEVRDLQKKYVGDEWTGVMEIYDLTKEAQPQLDLKRSMAGFYTGFYLGGNI